MTIQLNNISGTVEQMNDLFDNAQSLSVRYFCPSNKDSNNFDITIRCNEDVAKSIKRKRSLSSIIKADKS
jgi:hypothetical protein